MNILESTAHRLQASLIRSLSHRSGRTLIVAVSVFLIGTGGLGLVKLQTTPDNRIFYGADNRYFQDLLEFENSFSPNDNIALVLHSESDDLQSLLKATGWLTNQSWRVRGTIRVDSLTNLSVPVGTEGSIELSPLVEHKCGNRPQCLPEFFTSLADHKVYGRLISDNHTTSAVILTLIFPRGSPDAIQGIMNDIALLRKDFNETFPSFEILVTGGAPMMAAFSEASTTDLSRILPVSVIALLIALVLTLRNASFGLSVAAIGFAATVSTMGIFSLCGFVLNSATSIAPLVIFALVITPGIHLTSRFEALARSEPQQPRNQTAIAATNATFQPVLISVLTSALGLYSLGFADSPPLRELGIICGTGVLIGGALVLTNLPIILSALKIRTHRLAFIDRVYGLAQRLANYSIRSQRVSAGIIILFLIGAAGIARISVDDDFVRFFPEENDFRRDTDRIAKLLFSPHHLEVVIEAEEHNTILTPKAFALLLELEDSIRNMGKVASVYGIGTLLDPVREALSEEKSLAELSPEELSQLFFAYEISLPQGQNNTEFLSADHRATRISVFLNDVSTNEIKKVQREIEALGPPRNEGFSITVTGESIPVAHLTSINIRSMIIGIGGSVLGIALTFYLFQRIQGISWLLFLSIGIPLLAGFGLWGWVFGEIGIAAVAIISLTLGVIVDDTAHFLSECQRFTQRPTVNSHYRLIKQAVDVTTPGIVATSIVLSVAMGLLAFSGFEVNRTFGIVSSMIIALALVFTLFALPRLIYVSLTRRYTAGQKGIQGGL
jgi:predicted RND superfamily exporter protein